LSPKAISINARVQIKIGDEWYDVPTQMIAGTGKTMSVHSPHDPLRPELQPSKPKPRPSIEPGGEPCWNCDGNIGEVKVFSANPAAAGTPLATEGVEVCSPCAGNLTEGEDGPDWSTEPQK